MHAGNFVSHGDRRVEHLSDDGTVRATDAFAPGEAPVTLHGYAPRKPAVAATTGSVGAVGSVGYDTGTELFRFTATADPGASGGNRAVLSVTALHHGSPSRPHSRGPARADNTYSAGPTDRSVPLSRPRARSSVGTHV
ncbi:hypothetical protein ABZX65_17505 [Streptomyces sp. NPDC003300]|uniref:hypothetical protein n=1 Tax=unclassified Streptomyces TaxID=2593676 RepID=UPI0033A906C5